MDRWPTSSPRRTVTVRGPALPLLASGEAALQLSAIDGHENLSAIFRYTLDLLTTPALAQPDDEAANLDLTAMLGKELTVSIQLDGTNPGEPTTREISGLVTEARFVEQRSRQCHYQAIVRPWLYLADQRSDYRIFQHKTVVEIIDEVLKPYLYLHDKRLSVRYPNLTYQVQYGETDFAFIQRLMQEHGIYWFFEHSQGVQRLVLVDHVGAHKPVQSAAWQTLAYRPPGHDIDREYVDAFRVAESLQPDRWTTDDFDFEHPKADLSARSTSVRASAHHALERYEWPGDYTDVVDGERVAKLRMEEVRCHAGRSWGRGQVRNVVCGTTFTLSGYPKANGNREYLVIGARFAATETGASSGSGEFGFVTEFQVQPATAVFRPPRNVPKPRTSGPQTAIVVGPRGQEIWTDQYGRVKLKFHWDRSPVCDHDASCWVRVSYPWTGSHFGAINVPRVGTEVIVDFENGDPDRPIVTGRVYNALTMPPWDLPANATQSGMLTRSLKGHYGTANAIRFEDRQGAEELWIQAERNLRTEVENDETHSVLANRSTSVGGNEYRVVSGRQQTEVAGAQSVEVGADFALTSATQISLTCGAARLVMESNGSITINGVKIVSSEPAVFPIEAREAKPAAT
ncbi:type VI secretion system tip protein TssI/VgrG [Paraburkholderia sp. BCC1886]|uniref:type VI secretion system Vgr family protein n=1 Tax=Paraburkholderia sp. BCC1886 TaxID=2562670 RepID=UPI001182DF3A